MAILIDQDSRIILQGATGRQGRYHLPKLLAYGDHVVGGVSPGKGGQEVLGIPVCDTVAEVTAAGRVDATMIMVPPGGVLNAAVEAIDSWVEQMAALRKHRTCTLPRCTDYSQPGRKSRFVCHRTQHDWSDQPGKVQAERIPGIDFQPGVGRCYLAQWNPDA